MLFFYLRCINPVVSMIIAFICFYSGFVNKGELHLDYVIEGSFSSYFIAKGLFCGVAVFLLGKILEVMLTHNKTS